MELIHLFITFFKIGLFTFGGGYAMIPMITNAVVENNWLTLEQVVDFIGVAESTPGVFAVNISTFVGSNQGGFTGGVVATLAVVLPSFIIIILVAKNFDKFMKNTIFQVAIDGIKPAVVGLIGAAVVSVSMVTFFVDQTDLFRQIRVENLLILAFLIGINKIRKLKPISVIFLSAILGIILFR